MWLLKTGDPFVEMITCRFDCICVFNTLIYFSDIHLLSFVEVNMLFHGPSNYMNAPKHEVKKKKKNK